MKVFWRYTWRTLMKNRTRTILTVIGIVLSMMLFTAIIEGGFSGMDYLARGEKQVGGAWEGIYPVSDGARLEELKNNRKVRSAVALQPVGWAEIGSSNENKPYLLVENIDDNVKEAAEMAGIHLTSGRLPEKPDEILLPRHLETNGDVVIPKGEVLTLSLGKRVFEGEELHYMIGLMEGEELAETVSKTYTVVGTYERLDYHVEPYECPGYMALTTGDPDASLQGMVVLFTARYPWRFYLDFDSTDGEMFDHDALLVTEMALGNALSTLFFGFVTLLVLITSIGAIFLIRNAFSISVAQRTQELGILKSIGATRRQIRWSVIYEALILALIAIPIGLVLGLLGIGLTLHLLSGAFERIMLESVPMYLVVKPVPLVLSAIICLLTVLVSALIPAQRAIRITPMDGIRQTREIRLRPKDVKSSRWITKLFGLEGMLAQKNTRRNRRRSRAIVISLTISVVLFIAACSFSQYLSKSMTDMTGDSRYEYDIVCVGESFNGKTEEKYRALAGTGGILDGTFFLCANSMVEIPKEQVAQEYLDACAKLRYEPMINEENGNYEIMADLIFVEDAFFRQMCTAAGLDPERCFDASSPACVARNDTYTFYYPAENSARQILMYKILKEETLPYEIQGGLTGVKAEDGYTAQTLGIVPRDQYGAPLSYNELSLIFPYSMAGAVLGDLPREDFVERYLFHVQNHRASQEAMYKVMHYWDQGTYLIDNAQNAESVRAALLILKVFSYGFIILISLITAANAFNTIYTEIVLRRREFAELRSVGMKRSQVMKILDLECIGYGTKALAFGIPLSVLFCLLIYRVAAFSGDIGFSYPFYALLIAVAAVFLVVFAAMRYGSSKIRKENIVDVLKGDSI